MQRSSDIKPCKPKLVSVLAEKFQKNLLSFAAAALEQGNPMHKELWSSSKMKTVLVTYFLAALVLISLFKNDNISQLTVPRG